MFPFIFVLMDKRTKKAYDHLFNYIHNNIFKLDANSFMTDFETALQSSLKKNFANAKLYGCWFHFCQAIRRNIGKKFKNLSEYIRSDRKCSKVYHKFLTLPLLPAKTIPTAFSILTKEINTFDNDKKFGEFIEYFDKQWMKKVRLCKKIKCNLF